MDACDWDNRAAEVDQLIATLKAHLASEKYSLNIPVLFFNYFELEN